MLDVSEILRDTLFFEGPGLLSKPLSPKDTYLGGGLHARVTRDEVIVFYLDSSDQITIPGEYINLFRALQTRDGDRLRRLREEGVSEFISLGIELPDIFLYSRDSRGVRQILGRMVTIGTTEIRKILTTLRPWTLSNINNTLDV